jgi:hypothetical protein
LEACTQHTISGDTISLKMINNMQVTPPLEDAIVNMKAIETLICTTQ